MDALGLALVALAYAIASELLGLVRVVPAHSVIGLVMGGLASLRRRPTDESLVAAAPAEVAHSWGCCDYQELIELGYARRQVLLKRPGVEDVEISVMGEHLVLTVFRSGSGWSSGEHAEGTAAEVEA